MKNFEAFKMFIRKLIKWIMPYGIYTTYRDYKEGKIKQKIMHRGRIESVVLSDEMRINIGKDWISDSYYDNAEEWIDEFWSEKGIFYKNFCQLDCTNIVELACGHGRHIPKYLDKASSITLVDINQQNIDFCKKRFLNETKIKYVTNIGCDFNGIESNSQTAIFTYDAMVHFEMLDILSYIKDANRILVNGGKILFHHSNYAFSPESYYLQKPHGRNFMSADIFAYMALRMGFVILEQDIFSWGSGDNFIKDIDCLSLCQKVKSVNNL
jgi:ubiquinone/menaquinone biosynthesis C-methylase UbiE